MLRTRLILLIFAATEVLVAWSLRFLPRPIKSRLVSGILAVLVGIALFSVIIGQLLQYSAATGHVPLKNDSFFMVVFFAEHITTMLITLNSDYVARRKVKSSADS